MRWPLLHVLLLLLPGILIGYLLPIVPYLLLICGIGCVITALAIGRATLRAWFLGAAIVLTGWTNYSLRVAVLSPHDLRALVGDQARLATVRGVLKETPELRVYEGGKAPAWRTLARIKVSEIRFDKREWQPARGVVAATTPGALTNLFGGQEVEVAGVIGLPPGPVAEGTFDYRSFLRQQGVYYRFAADSEEDWRIQLSPSALPVADRFRRWASHALARGLPLEDESLRLEWALALGWKTALTPAASEPFIKAATYHIFAVDGLRMAIIFGILFGFLRVCRIPRRFAGLILLPVLWFYVALTGWPASAIRATVMLSIVILGWVLKRPGNILNSLFAAAILILLWEPRQLFQAGFQLSFVVVLFLILLIPLGHKATERFLHPDPLLPRSLQRQWPEFIRSPAAYVWDVTLTSFVAWIASIPLVAYYFNVVTPVSTPANLLAVPLCALVLLSNMGSLLLAPLWGFPSELLNYAGWFLMECIRVSSEWFARWPHAWFYASKPNVYATGLYYGLMLGAVTGWFLRPAYRWARLAMSAAAVAVWLGMLVPTLMRTELTILPAHGGVIAYFDAPGWRNDLLVDVGNTNGYQFVTKPFLTAEGVNWIRTMALSHGDLKHVGAARLLLEDFPVHDCAFSPVRFRSRVYRQLIEDLDRERRCRRLSAEGERLRFWQVLYPSSADKISRADDGALVLKGSIKGTRVLLLNDLGRVGQERLLERRAQDLKAEIVVTGLPSVGEPLSDGLLEAIEPKLIIIADSEYPANERASRSLQQRLAARKGNVLYTRLCGATRLSFGRTGWELKAMDGTTLNPFSSELPRLPHQSERLSEAEQTEEPGVDAEIEAE